MSVHRILPLDRPTSNQRFVSTETIQRAIDQMTFPVLGTLAPCFQKDRSIETASHVINHLFVEDGFLWADVHILDTRKGRMLSDLLKLEQGCFVAQYLGKVNLVADGISEVVEVSDISCFFTTSPSFNSNDS